MPQPPVLRGALLRLLGLLTRVPLLGALLVGPLAASLGLPALQRVALPGAGEPKPYIRTRPTVRGRR